MDKRASDSELLRVLQPNNTFLQSHFEIDIRRLNLSIEEYLAFDLTQSTSSEHDTIAVFVPYLPVHSYLAECLESLRSQRHRIEQIVVVVDGTSEAIPEENEFPDISFVYLSESIGPFRSIEPFIRDTHCNYVMFQDSDDISHPQRLSILLENLKHSALDAIGSTAINFEDRALNSISIFPAEPCTLLEKRYAHAALYPTLLMKASSFRELGGFSQAWKFAIDSEFIIRACKQLKIKNSAKPLYAKRNHSTSLCNEIDTGFGSDIRKRVNDWTKAEYAKIFC